VRHSIHSILKLYELTRDRRGISTAGAIVLKISHGYSVSETGKDPLVTLAEKTIEEFSLSTAPGGFWVDFLPWRASITNLILANGNMPF
jgi:hypothetical protein